MEKTIVIDGKPIKFKCTGATPLRYKAQFRKDYLTEILKLRSLEKVNSEEAGELDLEEIDFDLFYNIAWVMAKTADPSIPDPLTWLDQFDEFPLIEIIPDLQEMIIATIQGKKK